NAPTTMIMDLLGEDRTYGAAAERHGKLFLCGEFGGGASCNPDNLQIVESGLRRVLQASGVTKHAPATSQNETRLMKVGGAGHYLFSAGRGVFEPCFKLGDRVKQDQLAGRLYNLDAPWEPAKEHYFSGTGEIMVTRTFSHVVSGDCIAVIASPAAWY
ncbi:TPA: succinylglutamate desuccinylase/aspartoacylase family protein, partial [Klebsiella aerogenes]